MIACHHNETKHMLDEAFVANLPPETDEALILICKAYMGWNTQVKPADRMAKYVEYVDAFSFLVAFGKARSVAMTPPNLDACDRATSISVIDLFFHTTMRDAVTRVGAVYHDRTVNKFSKLLAAAFFYEFPKDDLSRIRVLINELKNEIWKTDDLDDDHKARLRMRFEKLLQGLHERRSDLDCYLGLIGEAAVLTAKVGHDAKPLVDRIRLILGIVLKVQAKSEGVPARGLIRFLALALVTVVYVTVSTVPVMPSRPPCRRSPWTDHHRRQAP